MENIRYDRKWQELFRLLPVLAVIELKDKGGYYWNKNIEKNVEKIIQRTQDSAIVQAYLAIFFDADCHNPEKYPIENRIKAICQKYKRIPNVIYLFPWAKEKNVTQRVIDLPTLMAK
jgi:hypothetical protein